MTEQIYQNGQRRTHIGLVTTVLGFFIFLLGAEPGLFNLDRSPVVGFVQIAVFLVGLAIICVGGYFSLSTLWNGSPKTIIADVGLRLVATGYVISVTSGMADIFGFGNQPWPEIPQFGIWQVWGVIIGEAVIILGFILMIPPRLGHKR
jgi:hypothetical protein